MKVLLLKFQQQLLSRSQHRSRPRNKKLKTDELAAPLEPFTKQKNPFWPTSEGSFIDTLTRQQKWVLHKQMALRAVTGAAFLDSEFLSKCRLYLLLINMFVICQTTKQFFSKGGFLFFFFTFVGTKNISWKSDSWFVRDLTTASSSISDSFCWQSCKSCC